MGGGGDNAFSLDNQESEILGGGGLREGRQNYCFHFSFLGGGVELQMNPLHFGF